MVMRVLLLSLIMIAVYCPQRSWCAQSYPYKNLSVNKNDLIDSMWNLQSVKTYPHAQSNSECRGEPWFRARCAISDTIKNTSHGQGFPSWGPDQRTDIWWKVNFGKNVLVDSITIYIRADFPHDGYWFKGRFNFSDGSKLSFALDSTARPQSFKFTQRATNFVLIDSLVWRQPTTWCAFTQVQVFGYDQSVGICPGMFTGANPERADHAPCLANPWQSIEVPKGAKETTLFTVSGRRIVSRSNQAVNPASFLRLSYPISQKIIDISK
jgi:hypothetical protein